MITTLELAIFYDAVENRGLPQPDRVYLNEVDLKALEKSLEALMNQWQMTGKAYSQDGRRIVLRGIDLLPSKEVTSGFARASWDTPNGEMLFDWQATGLERFLCNLLQQELKKLLDTKWVGGGRVTPRSYTHAGEAVLPHGSFPGRSTS